VKQKYKNLRQSKVFLLTIILHRLAMYYRIFMQY